MIKYLFDWLYSKNQSVNTADLNLKSNNEHSNYINDNTVFDIIISLNKNKKINISILIDDKNITDTNEIFKFGDNCGELLHLLNSGRLTTQIQNLLQDQIKNENNQLLIENIISCWLLHDKEFFNKVNKQGEKDFILPSTVFSYYNK